jgi:hypothetical protein
MGKDEYTRVKGVEVPNNRIIVALENGNEKCYAHHRQQGVSMYREQERAFSDGDRMQSAAPSPDLNLANRELGTIVDIREGKWL